MPGGSTTQQTQGQTSSTAPWAAALPLLSGTGGILDQLGNLKGATGPNQAQADAVGGMMNTFRTAPNFGGGATAFTNSLFSGGAGTPGGILNSGNNTLQSNLAPIASGSLVGKNPALAGQLATIQNDVTNNLSSEFAAAGRPVGTNADSAQAIARGVAQGEAPVLANQYNTDIQNQLAANQQAFGAAGNTASGLTGIGTAGVNTAGAVPGILNANNAGLLSAGNISQGLPFQGLGNLESLALPIAGLGANSTGTSTGSTTQQQPLGPTLLGGALGTAGLLGSTGAFGSAGWLAPLLLSDARLKEDVEKVGILNDGQNVYSFKYKNDPTRKTQIGLMAQEVERQVPDAVHEIGGVKFVDYGKATEGLGILNRMAA